MKFEKYNSIENSYRIKFINKLIEEGLAQEQWVVLEKIHGGNFAIYVDKDGIRVAKRTGFIAEDESFFNYQRVIDKHKDAIMAFYDGYKDNVKTISGGLNYEMVIYGEIFGGSYPHNDVSRINDACKVQKGVFYSPDNEFMIFDVKLDNEYMSAVLVEEGCRHYGLPYVPIRFKGTLEECLAQHNEFQTSIPGLLGLPEIEDNVCEGVVIKPNKTSFLRSGSRAIIKNKNAKFSEKGNKDKGPRIAEVLPGNVQVVLDEVISYVTENRLRNVISKIGEIGQKEFGKLTGLFVTDVFEDFIKDNEDGFKDIAKDERKKINKRIGSLTANLIRPNFANIVDGEF